MGILLYLATRRIEGLRAFAVSGPSCWNELPVELRDLTVGPETFAKHLKHVLVQLTFSDGASTFEFV